MAIGCGPKIAKFILIVFNVLFWLSGLILIIIGSVYLSNGTMKYIDDIVNTSTNRHILIGFLVIGIVIFVIGFCGCCGAIKESRVLLGIYILLLLCIIVAEIGFGIFAIIKRQTVETSIKTELEKGVKESYGIDPTITTAVDGIQQLIKCCGFEKPDDWRTSNWSKWNRTDTSQSVPRSCCSVQEVACSGANAPTGNSTMFTEGCFPKLQDYVNKYFPAIIGVALGIAFFEIFVVVCAFCLCRNTDSHSQAV